jgi:hypothetical protein
MYKFILIILLLSTYTNEALAQFISLTCNENKLSITTSVDFNEKEKIIINDETKVSGFINPNEIRFISILNNDEYYYTLNRSTGIMRVRDKETTLVATFKCDLRKNRF